MAILQLIPAFAVGNIAFVILPLAFVIFVSAAKDGFEDWKRSQADNLFNSAKTRILCNWQNYNYPQSFGRRRWFHVFSSPISFFKRLFKGPPQPSLVEAASGLYRPTFETVLWQDVRVGDFIYITKDEPIPADILLLSTSDPEGECYIETKNLDGETNLKSRMAIPETSHLQDADDCAQMQGYIDSDAPSSNLYYTNGSISLVEFPDQAREASFTDSIDTDLRLSNLPGSPIPFNIKNVLLRGCVLKNTAYAIGLVLFTGSDTKIILNSSPTPSKRSRIEKKMNTQVGFSFGILLTLGLITSIGYGIVCKKWHDSPVGVLFGIPKGSVFFSAFDNFWASLILLQNVIPVSLYVGIEFVKSWQAYFIFQDLQMYYEPTNSGCVAKSWTLSDDLGQVEYVFSDKTGTLTRNIMEFKKCSINGKVYGKTIPGHETDVEKGKSKRETKGPPVMAERKEHERDLLFKDFFQNMKAVYTPIYAKLDQDDITFADPELYRDLLEEGSQAEAIRGFFLNLALCHTVILEADSPDARASVSGLPELVYRAESPDEKALVAAARDLGFVFLGKTKNIFHVELLGTKYDFEQLAQVEFDSTRKRMSVIFKRPAPWDDVIVLCKGADNVILERLGADQDSLHDTTLKHLKEFSNTGLRTLCLAYRTLTLDEFQTWNEQYRAALSSTLDREYQTTTAVDRLERDFILMGSTAIEDKLQDQVPACIAALRQAGIKVWVLTGDKMETAINIGFGCSLLTKDMRIWTINGGTSRVVLENFGHVVDEMIEMIDDGTEHALVIEGNALKHILEKNSATKKLLALAPRFRSVVCCRTSPLQKAQVVRLIKKGQHALTLAIGDGANDVSMIQEAHVGVAIAGEEGLQASMVSDYTISQFRYLGILLLVHGQHSYHRLSEMILCFFYKNAIWTFAAFWYQLYCGFSSNYFFTYTLIPLYNLVFTAMPVVLLGITDQRLSYDYLTRYPQTYALGIQGKFFHNKLFWYYFMDGLWQSLIIFFGYFFLFSGTIPTADGLDSSAHEMSTSVAILVIAVANIFVGFHTRAWNWLSHFWINASVVFVFFFVAVYSAMGKEFYGVGFRLFGFTPSFWFAIPPIVVASLLPRYLYFYVKITFFPDDLDLMREIRHIRRKERKMQERDLTASNS
ncbi:hypothetical protein DSO57_1011495 [Entomophthora muscae]|uniref:Uncharacterized protein n=1 Tax=Entomophthora muscae TaxID=34485 RepID=A0ACC2TTL3_9FUNG|nr:hypothetical protein DSO57_1011495 [Entomophthora muscae]